MLDEIRGDQKFITHHRVKPKMDQEFKRLWVKLILSRSTVLCLYSSVSFRIGLAILMSQIQASFSETPDRFSH